MQKEAEVRHILMCEVFHSIAYDHEVQRISGEGNAISQK